LIKIKFFIVFIFFFIIFFYLDFFLNNYFRIKKIEIIGLKKSIFGLNEIQGENLLFISEKKTKKNLEEKNPFIKEIFFKKKFPSTLILEVAFYQPIAQLIVKDGFYDLAENGKIISKSREENKNLTKLNFYQKLNYQSYNIGEKLFFKEIIDGLYFLKSFADINMKVDNLDINGTNMLVFNLIDKKIIFSSEKEKKLQVFQMKEIIRRFKVEGKQYREVDLRFDKPIIRF